MSRVLRTWRGPLETRMYNDFAPGAGKRVRFAKRVLI